MNEKLWKQTTINVNKLGKQHKSRCEPRCSSLHRLIVKHSKQGKGMENSWAIYHTNSAVNRKTSEEKTSIYLPLTPL
jgi:hypothetical protein